MSLSLISTPIGNLDDLSIRAHKKLSSTTHIICEEIKTCRRRLSAWRIDPKIKKIYQLNEHSDEKDLSQLLRLCQTEDVVLVTDCGTPSFFDPGFQLVDLCYKNKIEVKSLPGVSSLTALMPFLDQKTERFYVLGFPPQKTEERLLFFKNLKNINQPFLLLDTPYRLQKTIDDLINAVPNHYCIFGINLTLENEMILRGRPSEIKKQSIQIQKENFVCMIYP